MSWPQDGLPRFKVTSVTGYPSLDSGGAGEKTFYQVLDRAYCHGLVHETFSRAQAEKIAEELERDRVTTLNDIRRNRAAGTTRVRNEAVA